MGFLDSIKKAFGSKPSAGGGSSFGGGDAWVYWVHAQCRRCGEITQRKVGP